MCEKHIEESLKWDLPLSMKKLRPLVMKSNSDLTKEEKWQELLHPSSR